MFFSGKGRGGKGGRGGEGGEGQAKGLGEETPGCSDHAQPPFVALTLTRPDRDASGAPPVAPGPRPCPSEERKNTGPDEAHAAHLTSSPSSLSDGSANRSASPASSCTADGKGGLAHRTACSGTLPWAASLAARGQGARQAPGTPAKHCMHAPGPAHLFDFLLEQGGVSAGIHLVLVQANAHGIVACRDRGGTGAVLFGEGGSPPHPGRAKWLTQLTAGLHINSPGTGAPAPSLSPSEASGFLRAPSLKALYRASTACGGGGPMALSACEPRTGVGLTPGLY